MSYYTASKRNPELDWLYAEIAAIGEEVYYGVLTPAQVAQHADALAASHGHLMDRIDILAGIEYEADR